MPSLRTCGAYGGREAPLALSAVGLRSRHIAELWSRSSLVSFAKGPTGNNLGKCCSLRIAPVQGTILMSFSACANRKVNVVSYSPATMSSSAFLLVNDLSERATREVGGCERWSSPRGAFSNDLAQSERALRKLPEVDHVIVILGHVGHQIRKSTCRHRKGECSQLKCVHAGCMCVSKHARASVHSLLFCSPATVKVACSVGRDIHRKSKPSGEPGGSVVSFSVRILGCEYHTIMLRSEWPKEQRPAPTAPRRWAPSASGTGTASTLGTRVEGYERKCVRCALGDSCMGHAYVEKDGVGATLVLDKGLEHACQ